MSCNRETFYKLGLTTLPKICIYGKIDLRAIFFCAISAHFYYESLFCILILHNNIIIIKKYIVNTQCGGKNMFFSKNLKYLKKKEIIHQQKKLKKVKKKLNKFKNK